MRLIGRLRLGGSALALLVVVVLVAPMFDCALTGQIFHAHAQAIPAEQSTAPVLRDSSDTVVHTPSCDCSSHAGHCLLTSAPPSGAGKTVVPQLLLLLAALGGAALVAESYPAGGGVRGPPVVPVPALGGRVILTRLCIARR